MYVPSYGRIMQMRYSPLPHQLNCEARILLLLEADSPRLLMAWHGSSRSQGHGTTGTNQIPITGHMVGLPAGAFLGDPKDRRRHDASIGCDDAGRMPEARVRTTVCGRRPGLPRAPLVLSLPVARTPGWAEFVPSVPVASTRNNKARQRPCPRPASGRN